jgi:class 3 adenylate cyclase
MLLGILLGDNMEGNSNQRRLAAILAADVAGYTQLVEQDTDDTVAAWKASRFEGLLTRLLHATVIASKINHELGARR